MKRPIALVAAAALASGLFAVVPAVSAQAAPVCEDPEHPINTDSNTGYSVELGTTKTQKLHLVVYTNDGCDVTGAKAEVTWPHGSKKVTLHKLVLASGLVRWDGDLKVSPKSLRNSDAGVWPTTFTVTGAHTDTLTVNSSALRRSRLSFNAGPEPVRDGKITFAGKLERANWNTHTYRGYSQPVEISYTFDDDAGDTVATPTTKANGTYRVTRALPGYGDYQAFFHGNGTTGPRNSTVDSIRSAR